MRATFLGGPRHGNTLDVESTPDRIWVDNEDGTKFLYAIKSEDLEGVGALPLRTHHVWYAEANIDDQKFYALQRSVTWPECD